MVAPSRASLGRDHGATRWSGDRARSRPTCCSTPRTRRSPSWAESGACAHSPRSSPPATAEPREQEEVVLARAVRAGALSRFEARLILRSRLEGVALCVEIAAAEGVGYDALRIRRRRAELRLRLFLGDPDVRFGGRDRPLSSARVIWRRARGQRRRRSRHPPEAEEVRGPAQPRRRHPSEPLHRTRKEEMPRQLTIALALASSSRSSPARRRSPRTACRR